MRWWPFARRENRDSGGEFNDAVLRLIETTAAGRAADTGATAAVEAAAGALARAFQGATVDGPPWARAAVDATVRAQIGRDLVRHGESMHVIRMSGAGVRLVPAASWHWEGDHDPATWRVRATAYGPSTSTTWHLPAASVVFVRWGGAAGSPYVGTGPLRWAAQTARLHSETERSLADEAGGPIAQILALPSDGKDGDVDPLAGLKDDIAKARGKAAYVETTAAGWGDGRAAAPPRDWVAERLGPSPPAALAEIRRDAFDAVLAACGVPPSLHRGNEDGTAQREAVRRWHLGTVLPHAKALEGELTVKLGATVRLRFDNYPLDLQARASALAKLTDSGMGRAEALSVVGLLFADPEGNDA